MKDKSFIGLFICFCTTPKGRKSRINFAWSFLTTPLNLKKEKNKTNEQKNVLLVKTVAVALALNHVKVP